MLALLLVAGARDSGVQQPGRERFQTVRGALSRGYALELISKPELPVSVSSGTIEGKAGSEENNDTYAELLWTEWSLYPPALVRNAGLKRIILAEQLAFGGQLRTAVPDFRRGDLYLDTARGRYDDAYVRRVIHHEFFHMIDTRDDGVLYGDPAWSKLNSAGFQYGSGGKNAQGDSQAGVARDDLPGFIDTYAMTGVEEDKAEVFAFLMVDPAGFESRAARDPVLRAKGRAMRALLLDFCPEMDAAFWRRVALARQAK
jgi:hypothetical protein